MGGNISSKAISKPITSRIRYNERSISLKNLRINAKPKIIYQIIKANGNFPNNAKLPLIIYKQALILNDTTPKKVQHFLRRNGWKKTWLNGIYDYHHFHSNTHEALVIYSGKCIVQVGGPKGKKVTIKAGDVIIFPAGVAHKNIQSSVNFKSIGCYPFAIDYDMHVGKLNERSQVIKNIRKVKHPKTDPIYGKSGHLFRYWPIVWM